MQGKKLQGKVSFAFGKTSPFKVPKSCTESLPASGLFFAAKTYGHRSSRNKQHLHYPARILHHAFQAIQDKNH